MCRRRSVFARYPIALRYLASSVQISANQFRPLDARFRFDQTAFLIERNHAIERARVDANAVRGKLLATHRMTAARNGDGQAFSRRRTHNLRKFISGARRQKLANAGAIELRMDVIDPNLSSRVPLECAAQARKAPPVRMNSRRVSMRKLNRAS